MKKYELINSDGCLMESVMATNMSNARRHFAALFTGNYRILCVSENGGEEINVRFS